MSTENGPSFDGLEVGEVVAERTVEVSRDALVRYAGASGDFNPIHYNDAVAESVGLPGVIAHGMLTMGLAASVVEEWAGPGNVLDLQTRFTRPIPVPALGETLVNFTVKVAALETEARMARVEIVAEHEGQKVLGKAQALVSCT